jgi:hypothetical protein
LLSLNTSVFDCISSNSGQLSSSLDNYILNWERAVAPSKVMLISWKYFWNLVSCALIWPCSGLASFLFCCHSDKIEFANKAPWRKCKEWANNEWMKGTELMTQTDLCIVDSPTERSGVIINSSCALVIVIHGWPTWSHPATVLLMTRYYVRCATDFYSGIVCDIIYTADLKPLKLKITSGSPMF